jgi:putative endonuclease
MKLSYVYIITNRYRTVFYTGVTADLDRRMAYHRSGKGSKFCAKYNVKYLVYYETFIDINDAFLRETRIKRWNRQWKIDLIRSKNHEMKDLMEKRGFPPARE